MEKSKDPSQVKDYSLREMLDASEAGCGQQTFLISDRGFSKDPSQVKVYCLRQKLGAGWAGRGQHTFLISDTGACIPKQTKMDF